MRIMTRFIYIIFFLFLCINVSAQKSDDYIRKQLDKGISCVNRNDYESSLDYFNKALNEAVKKYGDNSGAVIACKSQLANSYFNLSRYEEALDIFLDVAKFQKTKYGPNSQEYAIQLDHIASCYSSLENYAEAVDYCKEALVIYKPFFSDENLEYLFSLNSLSTYYSLAGLHSEALATARDVVKIVGDSFGTDGEDYITALEELLSCYLNSEQYEEAINLSRNIVDRNKKFYGQQSSEHISSKVTHATIFYQLEDYKKALQIACEAESIFSNNPQGKFDSSLLYGLIASIYYEVGDYQTSLDYRFKELDSKKSNNASPVSLWYVNYDIVELYQVLGNSAKALQYARSVIELSGTIDDIYYLTRAYVQLGKCYDDCGKYIEAITATKHALELIDSNNLDNDLKYDSLNSLACYYDNLGKYDLAIETGEDVVALANTIYGSQSIEPSEALTNLGAFYKNAAAYPEAIESLKTAIDIRESINQEESDNFSRGYLYATLSRVYDDIGDLSNANKCREIALLCFPINQYPKEHTDVLELMYISDVDDENYESALNKAKIVKKIRSQKLGKNHIRYAYSLHNLAYIYAANGDYKKALKYDKKSLTIRKRLTGTENPLYVSSLHNLAYDYERLGNRDLALELDLQAYDIAKRIFTDPVPDLAYSTYTVADDYYQSRQYALAVPYIVQALDIEKQIVTNSIKGLNTTHKESFWDSWSSRVDRLTHFCIQLADNPEMAKSAYNSILMSKGILLKSTEEFNRIISNIHDPNLKNIITEYNELRALYTSVDPSVHELQDSLENRMNKLEYTLLQSSPEFRNYSSSLEISWEDIRDRLNENEVAVEFYLDDYYDFNAYCAMVIRKDWDSPKVKYLFVKEFIDSLNVIGPSMYVDEISNIGYDAIWGSLSEFINGNDIVYFSTDGLMQQMNIELLGFTMEDSITNSCQFRRLSSTRELCKNKESSELHTASVYGGLSYDIDVSLLQSLHERYKDLPKSFTRGVYIDTSRKGWDYLPYSRYEAETVATHLSNADIKTQLLQAENGTEESFKALSGSNVSVVHVATHGFFYENEVNNTYYQRASFNSDGNKRYLDPMYRSGLIMSGGQNAWLGKSVPKGVDDGILLSKEISEMDLTNVQLFVLSACDTGIGEVKNDGVYGLQRALKLAGVETIIMSLWNINDFVTSDFMSKFYEFWLSGDTKYTAFKKAQNYLIEEYENPYYWAAFIMLD